MKNWLGTYTQNGGTKQDALRELNALLGTKYDTSHLSRWERGEREPNAAARYQMMLKVLPGILKGATPKRVREVAEELK